MSYEQAIAQWKGDTATAPRPLAHLEQQLRAGADPGVVGTGRALAIRCALGLAMLGFASMAWIERLSLAPHARSSRTVAVMLPIGCLLLAMIWLRHRDLARQMMVRALAWSALVIGTIVSVFGISRYCVAGPPIALGAGLALLLMGSRGLGVTSRLFQPMAFRNHLLLALVLATADAGTLLFAAAMQVGLYWQLGEVEYLLLGLPTLGCGLVMALAVGGMHRLRTWALVLNVVANVGIAFLAMSGYLGLTIPVATALAATATVQLLLPVPIVATALGDPLRDRSPLGRVGRPAMRLGLLLVMALGVVGPVMGGDYGFFHVWREGWIEPVHRTWVRGNVAADRPARRGPVPWRDFERGAED